MKAHKLVSFILNFNLYKYFDTEKKVNTNTVKLQVLKIYLFNCELGSTSLERKKKKNFPLHQMPAGQTNFFIITFHLSKIQKVTFEDKNRGPRKFKVSLFR